MQKKRKKKKRKTKQMTERKLLTLCKLANKKRKGMIHDFGHWQFMTYKKKGSDI